ncbi:MAG: RDD family protein [Pyrinomonadaceae bacterium]
MTYAIAPAPGSWQTPTADLYSPEHGRYSDTGSHTASDVRPSILPAYTDVSAGIVPHRLNYAKWGDRVLGSIIDSMILIPVFSILFLVVMLLIGFANAVGSALGIGVILMGVWLLAIIYNKIYLVGTRGASIGQGVMKLKVVDASGANVSMGKAALRQIAAVGISLTPILGTIAHFADVLWPLWDSKRQTLHDKAADAFVVKVEQ